MLSGLSSSFAGAVEITAGQMAPIKFITSAGTFQMHQRGTFRLPPLANPPTVYDEGSLYYDSTRKRVRCYAPVGGWQNLAIEVGDGSPRWELADSVKVFKQVTLASNARVDLASLLGVFTLKGKLSVVEIYGSGMIDVYIDSSTTPKEIFSLNGAITDTANKICVYFDSGEYYWYLKNTLAGGSRTFAINYSGSK